MSSDREQVYIEAQRFAIQQSGLAFERSGNALHAWDAYARARRIGDPVPPFVLEYLDRCAGALGSALDAERKSREAGPYGDRAKDRSNGSDGTIAASLGMKSKRGAPTVFQSYCDETYEWNWLAVGHNVSERIRLMKKDYLAFEEAAKAEGISVSTARRAWERYQRELPQMAAKSARRRKAKS
jgi:hypothetical protein